MWAKPHRNRSSGREGATEVFASISRSTSQIVFPPAAPGTKAASCSARSVSANFSCRVIIQAA
eukprot:7633612-Pyramimonas_sp.AAC.1